MTFACVHVFVTKTNLSSCSAGLPVHVMMKFYLIPALLTFKEQRQLQDDLTQRQSALTVFFPCQLPVCDIPAFFIQILIFLTNSLAAVHTPCRARGRRAPCRAGAAAGAVCTSAWPRLVPPWWRRVTQDRAPWPAVGITRWH